MSFPDNTSTQIDYTTVSYHPTYSSITNPTVLSNDGTSGIYDNTTNSIIVLKFYNGFNYWYNPMFIR